MDLEQAIEQHIADTFEKLPAKDKLLCEKSPKKWYQQVYLFALKRQLNYDDTSLKYSAIDKQSYYLELIRYSRKHYMIFPYHLSDILIRCMGITPFNYYIKMLCDVIFNGKSYDTIPNFTAADEYRWVGVERNEFIDTLNKYRTRGFQLKSKKTILKQLLPSSPIPCNFEYWWIVKLGFHAEFPDDSLTPSEKEVISYFSDSSRTIRCGMIPRDVLNSLYKKDKIYIEIPIKGSDKFKVPPLENFVMNRAQGDYFENLMYNLFFCFNERTTLESLASEMKEVSRDIWNAVSILVRLGYAKCCVPDLTVNVRIEDNELPWNKDWLQENPVENDSTVSDNNSEKRVCLVIDEGITAYLMMATLSPGLSNYAVTLYEVGKITHEKLDDFIAELEKLPSSVDDIGDISDIVKSLNSLTYTLKFLKEIAPNIPNCSGKIDILRSERVITLDNNTRATVITNNYCLLLSLVPLRLPIICPLVNSFGYFVEENNTIWYSLYQSYLSKQNCILIPRGQSLHKIPKIFRNTTRLIIKSWNNKTYTIKTENLIAFANHLLQSYPIIIKAFSYSEQNPDYVDVAFPVGSKEQIYEISENILDDDKYNSSEKMEEHPLVHMVINSLNLNYSCGYIRMIRMKGKLNKIAGTNFQTEWNVFNISEGIPFFSCELTNNICCRIKEHNLFTSESNLSLHNKSQMTTAFELFDFISFCCNNKTDYNSSPALSKKLRPSELFSCPFPNPPFPICKVVISEKGIKIISDENLFDEIKEHSKIFRIDSKKRIDSVNTQLNPLPRKDGLDTQRSTVIGLARVNVNDFKISRTPQRADSYDESKDSREKRKESNDTKENKLKSKENDVKSNDTKENDVKSNDTKEIDVKSNDTKEIDVKSNDTKEIDVKSNDTKEIDVKSNDTKEIDVKSNDNVENELKSNNKSESNENKLESKDYSGTVENLDLIDDEATDLLIAKQMEQIALSIKKNNESN